MLVELDPLSNKEGNTRAQSTDMHTLKPRHNLVVSFLKTLTPLTFRLVTQKPFMLVELDPVTLLCIGTFYSCNGMYVPNFSSYEILKWTAH